MSSKQAILIAGPTASGKSGLAVKIAKRHNGVVINADSMQAYDVLQEITARPTPADMGGVEHRLFGHVAPGASYNVAIWLEEARETVADVAARGRMPVIVGGTGLYFKALLEGLGEVPPIDPDIRRSLRDKSLTDLPALYNQLKRLDPESASKLEPGDTQRIVRALEVFKSTGRTLNDWHGAGRIKPVLAENACEKMLLMPPRKVLHERIEKRFHQMVEKGALEEVERIMALGLSREMPAMRAIGVVQLSRAIKGEITLAEAIGLAVIATRQYAKRQATWFRHQLPGNWVEQSIAG